LSEEKTGKENALPYRIGVRPSKPVSFAGMIVGAIFAVLGLAVIMPNFGIVGLAWTAIAGVITAYHGFNFFSTRGLPTYEVNIERERPHGSRR
jgi:hypothetical protein